jgi:hypothetical protein
MVTGNGAGERLRPAGLRGLPERLVCAGEGDIESVPIRRDTATSSRTGLDVMRGGIHLASSNCGGLDEMPLVHCAGYCYALRHCPLRQLVRNILDGPDNSLDTG